MNPPPPPAPPTQDQTVTPPPTQQFMWDWRLQADQGAGSNARLRVRTRLTMAHWPGDVEVAARMASHIADNAAKHGSPFCDNRIILRMEVMQESHELRIFADDADPAFPNFAEVSGGFAATKSGLWRITESGGCVSWYVKQDDGTVLGKTVQVIVPAEGGQA
ncbi:hypothetical protein ACIRP3_42685 [Streptomyces sp. NPDC101209]|uniref:hypothetical protein n=1 Tax=Streptomyces sp. NPDC101209 TaxID=3366129 RepID=UPI00380FB5CB